MGNDPESIRVIVQSHLHYDHIGGTGHFFNAEFLVHRAEWEIAHAPADWISSGKRSPKV